MPMPWTYRHSDKEFKSFLAVARAQMGLTSDNNTYTAVEGVLRCFRARLTPQQVVEFAQVLPCTLRSLLIERWDLSAPVADWSSRAEMSAEVKALRPHHNLTPDNAIEATAYALRRHLRQADLDRVLSRIGPEAAAFWAVEGADPQALQQKIL